jgi:hypothetical protein
MSRMSPIGWDKSRSPVGQAVPDIFSISELLDVIEAGKRLSQVGRVESSVETNALLPPANGGGR